MSSQIKKSSKSTRKSSTKRTPRTLMVEKNADKKLPLIIPEPFQLKNLDLVGKIDDMRALTKELSVMARQIEQWMGIIHTVSMAFKDNGVLSDVLKALATISAESGSNRSAESENSRSKPSMPFPFPFFGEQNHDNDTESEKQEKSTNDMTGDNPFDGINIFEIINNPAFQEMMSKLFLQRK